MKIRRLYANNDAANVLWEFAIGQGLMVSYKLPHEETFIAPEEINGFSVYRLLGGLRLKYSYALPPHAEPITYIWKFAPVDSNKAAGRFCDDFGVEITGCPSQLILPSEVAKETVYWEPPEWSTDVDYMGSVVAKYRLNGEVKSDTAVFRVASRVLEPKEEPLKGSDVQMLEAMLWQLGLSAQKSGVAVNSKGVTYISSKAGSEGARINSDRGGSMGRTQTCSGVQADDRSVFYPDATHCPIGNVATELMVKRFNARRKESGGIVTIDKVNNASGTVTTESLGWLDEDWNQYYSGAYRNLQTPDGIFDQNSPGMDVWFTQAVAIWQNGLGSKVPPTLNDQAYNLVLTEAGLTDNARTQKDLLIAWLEEETEYHWGTNKSGYQATKYRMTEGGADENGSLSFSQLLYHYRYGPKPCAAHKDANLNLYHPGDNLKSMVIHTATDDTHSGETRNCQGGMDKAFVDNGTGHPPLRLLYNSGITTDMPLSELKGYINNTDGKVVAKAQTNREDDYEALAKAIAIYNGNGVKGFPFFTKKSWPWMLRYMKYVANSSRNSKTVCHSCKYSINVRNKIGVLAGYLRRYVWQGGVYLAGDPKAGQSWCFAYGESEWLSGATWQSAYDDAQDRNPDTGEVQIPQGRVACAN